MAASSGDDGRAEEIVAGPICSNAIVVRSSKRHVDDAALLIDRHVTPDVDAGALLPTVSTPGVVACFSGARHRVKCPYQLSGVNVPGARITGGAESAAGASAPFSGSCAGNDEIFIDDRRRRQNVELVCTRAHHFGRTEIYGAIVAEGRVSLSGCRANRIKEAMIGSEEEGGAGGFVSGPIFGSAQRCLIGSGNDEDPFFFAGGRIQGDHAAVGRYHEHGVSDDQRLIFRGTPCVVWRAAGGRRGLHVINPCDLEMADIRRRDLVQRRIARGSVIEINHRPGSRCALRCNRWKTQPCEQGEQQQDVPQEQMVAGGVSGHSLLEV